MKIQTGLSFCLLITLSACASTEHPSAATKHPCATPQAGEGLSYSDKAKALRAVKASERPENKAAFSLRPLHRPIASLPPRFLNGDYSGNCQFIFDVNEGGEVVDLDIFACSSPLLKEPTRIAVMQWKYDPPLENGEPAIAKGVQSKMNFEIRDGRGLKCPVQQYRIKK